MLDSAGSSRATALDGRIGGAVGGAASWDSDSMSMGFSASFDRVEMALYGSGDERPRIVALCAEPGSGRHDAMAWVAEQAPRHGYTCLKRTLHGLSPVSAADRVARAVRQVSTSEVPLLLEVEEFPAADEDIVARVARALRRAAHAGSPVLLSVAPEARQLVESLPEAVVLTASDLSVRAARTSPDTAARRFMRLTHGIPSLARTLDVRALQAEGTDAAPGVAYYDALSALARAAVRTALPDEERRVRLAMLLIGAGSVEELKGVAGDAAAEVLEELVDVAPLFGVCDRARAFDCLTAVSTDALAACLQRLEPTLALFPDVARGSLEVLLDRGELGRAALVGELPECADALDRVLERGCDLLDAGEIALARKAASAVPSSAASSAVLAGVRALSSKRARRPFDAPEGDASPNGRAARLLVDARRILQGHPSAVPEGMAAESELERRLLAHRGACDLLLQGRNAAAMRLVISVAHDRAGASVSSELLDLDLEVARLLSGEASVSSPAEDAAAYPLIAGGAVPGFAGYLAIARLMRAVAGGGGDPREAEALAASAERSGEVLLQIVALIAGCVFDLRGQAATRARVRALLAASLATGRGLGYLERVARLLAGVSSYLMGERGELPPLCGGDDLGAVGALVVEAMRSEDSALVASEVTDRAPWDALWLLAVVWRGLGELSELVDQRMPATWRRALVALVGEGQAGPSPGGSQAPREVAEDPGLTAPPIEISLLGGFTVRVRGVRVPDWKLERRNARSMLEYMVLERGSSLKRFRLVDQVWPDCDYVTGFNRAYQATTTLRKAIAEIDPTVDPFVTSRSSKEVTLDMGLVACDVDEFRRVAREASDSESDEEALRLARRAEQLYEGDLYLPPVDATGYIAVVRAELRSLFSDAMVAGATAALRLGHARTAVRLAHNALITNDLREDAMAVLVRALRESGRSREAARRYEAFVARLENGGAEGPSPELAEAIGGLDVAAGTPSRG